MPLSSHIRSTQAARIFGIILTLVTLLTMSGCWMFSMRPLFDGPTDPNLIFDQNLVGAWGRLY